MILPATISPLKSETTIASANDCVAAADPGDAKTAARDRPTLTTEPSAGYWNDCTSAVVDVGHSRSPSDTPSWPGIVIRRRNALAPVFALRGGGAAEAMAVKRATATTTATAKRITADQGSAAAPARVLQTSCTATAKSRKAKSFRSVASGSSVTILAPISTPTIDERPTTIAVRTLRLP